MIPSPSKQIAYAHTYIGFALEKLEGMPIEEIVLFGSAARGEATKKSDIDLFFHVGRDEKKVREKLKDILAKFTKSSLFEQWRLKGIEHSFHIEVGDLSSLSALQRSIISDGIVLYGPYRLLPEKTKAWMYVSLRPVQNIAKRNRVIRFLFGRKEKRYALQGRVEGSKGNQLSPTSCVVPAENAQEILEFLQKEKIDFISFEFWTDRL